jgi:hypothetical protein
MDVTHNVWLRVAMSVRILQLVPQCLQFVLSSVAMEIIRLQTEKRVTMETIMMAMAAAQPVLLSRAMSASAELEVRKLVTSCAGMGTFKQLMGRPVMTGITTMEMGVARHVL